MPQKLFVSNWMSHKKIKVNKVTGKIIQKVINQFVEIAVLIAFLKAVQMPVSHEVLGLNTGN